MLQNNLQFTLWRAIILTLLAVGGLWISLHYTYSNWLVDPDIADPIMLWRQFRGQGIEAFEQWGYTPDNWLLSLLPFDFLIYLLFGASPAIVIGTGWFVFLCCCGITSLILYRVCGVWPAVSVGITLLFANHAASGDVGYLSYSATHNISVLWGLGAVLFALRWIVTERRSWLVACDAALFIATLSDPWSSVTFTLPLLAAGLMLAVHPRRACNRRSAVELSIHVAIIALLVRTRLFGFLWFLPNADFKLAFPSQIIANLGLLMSSVATLLNVIPWIGAPYGPSFSAWACPCIVRSFKGPLSTWMIVLDCVLVAVVLGYALARAIQEFPRLSAERQLLAAVGFGSLADVTIVFLTNLAYSNIQFGRFLQNIYFFVPLLIASVVWECDSGRRPLQGSLAAICCVLFILAGLMSDPRSWMQGWPVPDQAGIPRFVQFLEEHKLTYGYGPYWGTAANAVSWLSGGRVLIRPVRLHRPTGRFVREPVQTAQEWYTQHDIPSGQETFFLAVAPDYQMCARPEPCIALARSQFGNPDKVVYFDSIPILVWNSRIPVPAS